MADAAVVPRTISVATAAGIPLGSPARPPLVLVCFSMHMIVNQRPAVLARMRALLADRTLLALLALALALRLAAIVAFPSLHHPDENFQLLEQAHRIAFGYGVVPWEFRDGIRSPVLPYVLAGLFRLGERLAGGPEGYLLVTRAALAALSLLTVVAVYRMGQRTSRTHAVMAALVAATWFELVYFAGRPLTEAVATTFLVVALSLASVPAGAARLSPPDGDRVLPGARLDAALPSGAGALGGGGLARRRRPARALVAARARRARAALGVRDRGLAVLGRAVLLLCGGFAHRPDRRQGLDLRGRSRRPISSSSSAIPGRARCPSWRR